MTLTDFLLARIAEDEEVARHAADLKADFIGYDTGDRGEGWRGEAGPYDPARVLAECEAKTEIVDLVAPVQSGVVRFWTEKGEAVLHSLAAIYADHPDYREEWRP